MTMRALILLVSLAFAIAAYPDLALGADKPVSEDCRDDRGNDRCASDIQKKMRSSYGLDDAESLMAAGVTVRRAMYVDGYGRDVIAISFVRKPGASPFVEIRSPCAGQEDCPIPVSTVVSPKLWGKVIEQSQNFEQKLASELASDPTGKDAPITICVHSWVVVAEAIDAPAINQSVSSQEMTKGALRRDTEDSCTKGLAVPYSFQLAERALESLPECSGLDLDRFRNIPMLLATCNQLRGDRLAAADAYALVRDLNNVDWDKPADFQGFFALHARSRMAAFARDLGKGKLYLRTPHATDPDNANVKGEVAFYDSESDTTTRAPVALTLAREYGDFKIVDYNVGARKPVRD
jgi:hypothetical protein